jgi:mRNA interferase YafQ
MAKFSLHLTKRYLRDLKLARKRGMDESLLNEIIGKLLEGEPLPEKNHDHQLHGDYEGYRECHITPDWLLIYIKDTEIKIISLSRTGTHSDLFSKKNKRKAK